MAEESLDLNGRCPSFASVSEPHRAPDPKMQPGVPIFHLLLFQMREQQSRQGGPHVLQELSIIHPMHYFQMLLIYLRQKTPEPPTPQPAGASVTDQPQILLNAGKEAKEDDPPGTSASTYLDPCQPLSLAEVILGPRKRHCMA